MTVIEKLSDRHGFIFEAIKMVLVNSGKDENGKPVMMSPQAIQWKLFQCGVYLKGSLLTQAISVMNEKGELTKPNESKEPVSEKTPA